MVKTEASFDLSAPPFPEEVKMAAEAMAAAAAAATVTAPLWSAAEAPEREAVSGLDLELITRHENATLAGEGLSLLR